MSKPTYNHPALFRLFAHVHDIAHPIASSRVKHLVFKRERVRERERKRVDKSTQVPKVVSHPRVSATAAAAAAGALEHEKVLADG